MPPEPISPPPKADIDPLSGPPSGGGASPRRGDAHDGKTSKKPRTKKRPSKAAKPKGKAAAKTAAKTAVKPTADYLIPKGPIALVGLMGVGKTTVGRRLAKELGRPFYDSDDEIEKASGRTVAGYFRDHGETEFRAGERRVIDRLLNGDDIILATGGGAFIEPQTQEVLNDRALTIFLKGDFETLFTRVRKKDTRPLLKVADPRARYRELYDERYPVYARAHITVEIAKGPHARTVNRVLKALDAHHRKHAGNSS